MRKWLLILALSLPACFTTRSPEGRLGTTREIFPQAVTHATRCFEAIEGLQISSKPVVPVYITSHPQWCANGHPDKVLACASKYRIILIHPQWRNDNRAGLPFPKGYLAFAHEYMHVLYDEYRPEVEDHHALFEARMDGHSECNYIPRRNTY